jgi:hypothetical protein
MAVARKRRVRHILERRHPVLPWIVLMPCSPWGKRQGPVNEKHGSFDI